ncbi:hypothetical protein J2T13_005379 [Paenibacillus sp. DS2015]
MAEPPGPTVLKPFGRQKCATLCEIPAITVVTSVIREKD